MKRLLVSLAVVMYLPGLAQEVKSRHVVSGEFSRLGTVGFTGIIAQYDYLFKASPRGFYDVGAGLGGYGFTADVHGFALRNNVTYNFGARHHFFEIGFSSTYVSEHYANYNPTDRSGYFIGPMLGYRSISPKGFQFRFYLNTYLNVAGSTSFQGGGIGFGKAFRRNH